MKEFLFSLLVVFTPFLFSISYHAQNKKPKFNISIIHVDQWSSQLNVYANNQDVITPYIDGLAKISANFVNKVLGLPVCSSSRASSITDQKPLNNGIFINYLKLNTNAVTMAKVCNKNGCQTG